MRGSCTIAATTALLLCAVSAPAGAQAPMSAGTCLSEAQRATNAAYHSLTRPTSRDDQMPFFDPEYFVGTWDVLSRAVDSPLGPGGESAGVVTIQARGGCSYGGELKGEDPDGRSFSRTIAFSYDAAVKRLTWTEVDSRGYTLDRSGVVGGELGGLFHHHFEDVPAIRAGGHEVRITGVSEMSSPA